MTKPLISALYITKNGEHFLNESMLSIHKYVDEIIVSDNCSSDKTLEIAKKYKADMKIKSNVFKN
jgi:glycosyltransferase involved in cell wall biosynthesis